VSLEKGGHTLQQLLADLIGDLIHTIEQNYQRDCTSFGGLDQILH
jgi:hypothetical protein